MSLTYTSSRLVWGLMLLMVGLMYAESFSQSSARNSNRLSCFQPRGVTFGRPGIALWGTEEPSEEPSEEAAGSTTTEATRQSLEDKMKNWEASEEEIKAATLGGVVPQRTDSFDVGLYVAFPFMVIGCLLFLAFPFIIGNIDVSSVGPPPTS